MDLTRHLLFTFLALIAYLVCFVCACRELKQNEDAQMPLVIPLETRQIGMQNLRRLGLSKQKLQRLINDCNSNSIVRAIRRPNIVSEDSVKLRICLSLLDVLHNAQISSKTKPPQPVEIVVESDVIEVE